MDGRVVVKKGIGPGRVLFGETDSMLNKLIQAIQQSSAQERSYEHCGFHGNYAYTALVFVDTFAENFNEVGGI